MSYYKNEYIFRIIFNIVEIIFKSIKFIFNLYSRNKFKLIINKCSILIFIITFLLLSHFFFPIIFNKFNYLKLKYEFSKIESYFKICNNEKLINNKISKKVHNPKISIISPIYNREKYILRFLRSIQNQFFNDIEIIFVDDLSKDNSVKLIKEYQKYDERIILLKHNKNKGTLISRNDGALFSKGEYIMFPDPDDIISESILYNCYTIAKNNNYEMIRFNIYKGNGNIFFDLLVKNLENGPIYKPQLFYYLFYGSGILQQIDFNLTNKFIKRETYIRVLNSINNFYLNQYMTNLEDGIMNYILYRISNSFYFTKMIGYYYIQNSQSITIKPTINFDEKVRFIFIHLKFAFENSKNNRFEKDMINSLFKRLYKILGEDFKLITRDFQFYSDIINMYFNSKLIDRENKIILNRMKKILNNSLYKLPKIRFV